MKVARYKSDYSPNVDLQMIQTVDGDIILDISGDDENNEFRIAASGSKMQGKKLTTVINFFAQIIDVLNDDCELKE